ncbi:MAG: S9 family peptidase [Burkholderiales bacterium]|nr:S9 family peptidase [Burkholderiales bacterium]
MPRTSPYGSWRSPISAEQIAAGSVGLSQPAIDAGDIYWVESRPAEGGRNVIVRREPGGRIEDMTPPPFNARSRVHEYGGGACTVHEGTIWFCNFSDQRLFVQRGGEVPRPLTPAGPRRYADLAFDARRKRLVCVLEDHAACGDEAAAPGSEPVNSLVAIDAASGELRTLAAGADFYASPRVSPDGGTLAWLAWNHPNMPWDGTELWTGRLLPEGGLAQVRRVAGGAHESIFQPAWSPEGELFFVSDRSGWWNLYRACGGIRPLVERALDFGRPQWVFGMSTYAPLARGRIACTFCEGGRWRLAQIDVDSGRFEPIETAYTEIADVRGAGERIVFVGASPSIPAAVVRGDLAGRRFEPLRAASTLAIDEACLSTPRSVEFPTAGGLTAHAHFYRPWNRDFAAPPGEAPPLLVKSHGGPTSAASTAFNAAIQYWASRGVAVLDVNYGGSSGYGRAYRKRLDGRWGVVDVDDCVNAALYLAARGEADSARLAISGGSAGGYTTLCALTFRDAFRAGASHYGICDLEALVRDTHKFESRYLERLVGPYPDRRDLYRSRSPIHHTGRLACPLILFQGLEDKIVPPNQAEMMAAALRARGLPVAYLPFPGEQHGFRRAHNIRRALEAELYFYSRIFRFELAEPVEPVVIENL